MVPFLAPVVVFCRTVMEIAPLPVPADVVLSQLFPLVTVAAQAQVDCVFTNKILEKVPALAFAHA